MSWQTDYLATMRLFLQRRQQMGISQEAMASRLGISRRQFQRYEAGEYVPDAMLLFKWADILDASLSVWLHDPAPDVRE